MNSTIKITDTYLSRFLSRIDKNGPTHPHDISLGNCWIWTGCKSKAGYGVFFINGLLVKAHRLSYELFVGKIPIGEDYHGTCACHSCDNRQCVNPYHIFLGTNLDNIKDRDSKKRGNQPHGENHYNAKINQLTVDLIRKKYDSGNITQTSLSKEFGISQSQISYIVNYRLWNNKRN